MYKQTKLKKEVLTKQALAKLNGGANTRRTLDSIGNYNFMVEISGVAAAKSKSSGG